MASQKWFKAKRVGFSLYPVSWEGWITLSIYLVLEIKLVFIYSERLNDPLFNQAVSTVIFFFLTAVLTSILILISYHKGEKTSWPASLKRKRGEPALSRTNQGKGKKKRA